MQRRFDAPAHLAAGLVLVHALAAVAAGQTPSPEADDAGFSIFVQATPAGFERTRVIRTPDGWIVRASGQVTAPIAIDTERFEAVYDADWRPRSLVIEATRDGIPFSLRTTFADGTATNEVREGTVVSTSEEPVDPAAVLLPNFFFGAYEALAARVSDADAGDRLPVYVAPRGNVTVRVDAVDRQQLDTAAGPLVARVYRLTFDNPGAPLAAELWVDEDRRLLRLSLPSAGLEVARRDVIAVSTRLATDPHPGDAGVRVQAAGFSLAATLTTPVDVAAPPDGRWPAVVLVPGSGPVDRDETVFGIPIFRQLAHALADRGVLVARYDKRGIGQSGGRRESATLDDYAEDARQMVRYLERRDDVDRDRIVVIGHSEGGWVSLMTARRENRVGALVLVATPGLTGEELVLEQQQTELTRIGATDADREAKVALQQRIHRAVLGDGDWTDVPAPMRAQADTLWFRSFLGFDPADVVRRVRQPILIVQGDLDQQVPPHHADRLEALARARGRDDATVDTVRLAGINHLLVPAETGSVAEYGSLAGRDVTPDVAAAIADWIAGRVP